MSKDVSIDTNDIRNLGTEVPLNSIEEWSDIEPDINISGVDRPFFSFFKIPIANNIERKSPLGVSVYARAIEDIEEADVQASRMDWEFESKETAIELDGTMIEEDIYGTKKLPKGKERLLGRMTEKHILTQEVNYSSILVRKYEMNHFHEDWIRYSKG